MSNAIAYAAVKIARRGNGLSQALTEITPPVKAYDETRDIPDYHFGLVGGVLYFQNDSSALPLENVTQGSVLTGADNPPTAAPDTTPAVYYNTTVAKIWGWDTVGDAWVELVPGV